MRHDITYNHIIKYPHIFNNIDGFSSNTNILIVYSTDNDYIEYVNKYLAGKRIFKYWFRANTNPEYLICKNRLLREYNQDYLNQM